MFLEEEVFDEGAMDHTALVLVGASHLRNLARFFSPSEWQVYDLTTPGWHISQQLVQLKLAELEKVVSKVDLEKTGGCTVAVR